MKKAFTMIELVFVIVVAAILAVAIMPRMSDDSLRQAADQILMHIRYAQHLAMVNDKYDPSNKNWYKSYWQIYFNQDGTTSHQTYTVFSDTASNSTGNPDGGEIAQNPFKPHLVLAVGHSGITTINNPSPELDLTSKFGIKEIQSDKKNGVDGVVFEECKNKNKNGDITTSNTKRIAFDELGRPYIGNMATIESYDKLSNRLLINTCKIRVTNSNNDSICILVEPETGYSCIDEDCDGTCDR